MEKPLSKSQMKKLAAQKFNEQREIRLVEEAKARNRPLTEKQKKDRMRARLLLATSMAMNPGVI